jgi:hypothetical protein
MLIVATSTLGYRILGGILGAIKGSFKSEELFVTTHIISKPQPWGSAV